MPLGLFKVRRGSKDSASGRVEHGSAAPGPVMESHSAAYAGDGGAIHVDGAGAVAVCQAVDSSPQPVSPAGHSEAPSSLSRLRSRGSEMPEGPSPVRPPLIMEIDTSTVPEAPAFPPGEPVPEPAAARAQRLGRTIHRSASPRTAEEVEAADERKFVDEFGFELTEEGQVAAEMRVVRSINGQQVLRREIKWARMTADWHETVGRNFTKMKERSRKGIPSKLRGVVWQLQVGCRVMMEAPENRGAYARLLTKPLKAEVEGFIERDLGRTFPTHCLFREVDGVGQAQLRNVLHAYAIVDPEVGYVQGMGFIVAALLTQMSEEECFWCLHSLMHNETYRMREMYKPGFPMLQLFFFQFKRLLAQIAPRLSQHLEAQGVDVSFYGSQWFLTLFVYHFTFRSVLRIWDVFFCEGWKVIFRVGVALLRWHEAELLSMQFDELMPRIKILHEGKDADEIMTRAMKVKFKTEQLLALRREYEAGAR